VAWLATAGTWIWYVLWALLLLVASLFVYVGLGGNFIIVGLALIHALVTGFAPIGWPLLLLLLGLAVLGEILEFLIGTFYVARQGASRQAVVGAFLGGLAGAALGAPTIPLLGLLLGGFLGAFAGAVLGEYHHQRQLAPSLRIGTHAFIGKLSAILVKHAIGLVMVGLVLRATWPG
jgi:uncharacterized protein YqgC (DUF456 family)